MERTQSQYRDCWISANRDREIANDLIQVPHGGRGSILVNGVNRVQSDVGGIAGEVGGSLDNTFDTSLSDDTSLVRRRLLLLQPESALLICRRG